ncbi:hypothetical protein EMIT053CA3_80253 [Pseudomonas donghuensis]
MLVTSRVCEPWNKHARQCKTITDPKTDYYFHTELAHFLLNAVFFPHLYWSFAVAVFRSMP